MRFLKILKIICILSSVALFSCQQLVFKGHVSEKRWPKKTDFNNGRFRYFWTFLRKYLSFRGSCRITLPRWTCRLLVERSLWYLLIFTFCGTLRSLVWSRLASKFGHLLWWQNCYSLTSLFSTLRLMFLSHLGYGLLFRPCNNLW